MNNLTYSAVLNPLGRFNPWTVCAISITFIIALCLVDIFTPEDIRLHVLYLFPLAAITYYGPARWMSVLGLLVSIFAQLITLYLELSSTAAFVTDILVAFASSCLTIGLAQKLRTSYIEILHLAE